MSTVPKCPKCGSNKVMWIAYGLLRPDYILRDDEIPGGCCVSEDDPKWHCGACYWEWNCEGYGAYNLPEEDKILNNV